jgi:hypothetical protein
MVRKKCEIAYCRCAIFCHLALSLSVGLNFRPLLVVYSDTEFDERTPIDRYLGADSRKHETHSVIAYI